MMNERRRALDSLFSIPHSSLILSILSIHVNYFSDRRGPHCLEHRDSSETLMRILVTGGAGYIGSVVAEELIAAGHDTVVFDNLSKGHRAAVHTGARFVEGDLRAGEEVRRAVREQATEGG